MIHSAASNFERRNEYGYPIADKLARAKEYAQQVKARNQPPCQCDTCKQLDLLPAVQRITERWRT